MFQYFQSCKKSDVDLLTRRRAGETKLGEVVKTPDVNPLRTFLENTSARFVVLGIAEDIGVLANGGNSGTASAWDSFLKSFLNIQANDFTVREQIAVLGHFDFNVIKQKIEKTAARPDDKVEQYRNAVAIIDEAVAELIQTVVACRKIPIVIGGGHNNAYPIIMGSSRALVDSGNTSVNCVNLDAHIDYRIAEGRHSGNGFRYAKHEGFLQKYFALGIHENYIPDPILNEVKENADIEFITYEDIFIYQRRTWAQALEDASDFIGEGMYTGIELDLDCIEFSASSAATPCGISSREALQYVAHMSTAFKVVYLHVCEGIADEHRLTGKHITYIVSCFVKAFCKKNLDESQ